MNYRLSEANPRIHMLFVRTRSASNGCKRTLWKKKNEYRYLTYKTIIENLTNQQIRYLHVNYKH